MSLDTFEELRSFTIQEFNLLNRKLDEQNEIIMKLESENSQLKNDNDIFKKQIMELKDEMQKMMLNFEEWKLPKTPTQSKKPTQTYPYRGK